ncbi:MAG: hypothetical protein SFV53_06305, partial [Rickettsiales bacterium]|nr:hypothetical protein [Rickettsiales bacterium]
MTKKIENFSYLDLQQSENLIFEQNEFFDEASIKKIIYDFAIGITDVAKFNKLLANPKILNLLLKGDQ